MFELTTHTKVDYQDAVLKVLRYYSLFNYPLKINEIHGSCTQACTIADIKDTLDILVKDRTINSHRQYYSCQKNVAELAERREEGNRLALKRSGQAKFAGNIISKFPFVKFVGISGSLSKGCIAVKDDFDFFIVTEKNRLWIAYLLLHAFKKLTFLLGMQHRFCMNYFIDTSALAMTRKHIYIAVELESLIPLYGTAAYQELMSANAWTKHYLPNDYVKFDIGAPISNKKGFLKRSAEFILNLLGADNINYILMQKIEARRRRKWGKNNLPVGDYAVAIQTSVHVSRNHRADRQKNLMKYLEDIGYK